MKFSINELTDEQKKKYEIRELELEEFLDYALNNGPRPIINDELKRQDLEWEEFCQELEELKNKKIQ